MRFTFPPYGELIKSHWHREGWAVKERKEQGWFYKKKHSVLRLTTIEGRHMVL